MGGSRLTVKTASDYLFRRDLCSYGYFLLAPNLWDPRELKLTRPLDLSDGLAVFEIDQPGNKRGGALRVRCDRKLSRVEQAEVRALLTRMLNLNDEGVREFHKLDPRWKRSGRGRLSRSPTFFEDVIKTVTSCNVTWPSTMTMNVRLCEVVNPAFPRATQLAKHRPETLRARCSVGYRDQRIVQIAKLFVSGAVDPGWFEDIATPDDEVYAALLALPGIGPYGAANIMQLLGRYSFVALDTESLRHARSVLGWKGEDGPLMKRLAKHYERYGDHRFRSYWFELWADYEGRKGPAHTWDPNTSGRTFTAAQLNKAKPATRKRAASKTAR
jgi:3-methyladenine DNA glycosylase/8-oxoguanine DNA glycosylase